MNRNISQVYLYMWKAGGSDHNIADFVDTNTENSRNSNNQSFLGIAGLHGRPPEIVNQKISTLKSQ